MRKENKISRSKGGKRVYCHDCLGGSPISITRADYLVLVNGTPCDIAVGKSIDDKRVVGICSNCLESKSDFQKRNVFAVDVNNPNLVSAAI